MRDGRDDAILYGAARGGKSRFHSCTRPISRMPAGSVYFVSFYITRYPRDLDSIYFLLALRHECTGPIFDVGGRIFSGRNDRWIFLYFPFPRHLLFLHRPVLFPSGTLASFNRDITLHTPTASQNNTRNSIYLLVPGNWWISIRSLFAFVFLRIKFRFFYLTF